MQGLYIYAVFAFLYYAGMSVGITFEMKGSTLLKLAFYK